jgi:hypothetical protein
VHLERAFGRRIVRQHDLEGQIAAFMGCKNPAVEPDFGKVIDSAETEDQLLASPALGDRQLPRVDGTTGGMTQIGELGLPWGGHLYLAPVAGAFQPKAPGAVEGQMLTLTGARPGADRLYRQTPLPDNLISLLLAR